MANEAVIILAGNHVIRRTCADGTSISKGTILKLSDANLVTASAATDNGVGQPFGGIAAADKVANDGATTIPVYMDGTFDLTCNAGATLPNCGVAVTISGANLIRPCTAADLLSGSVIGNCEEHGSASEVIRVRLRGN